MKVEIQGSENATDKASTEKVASSTNQHPVIQLDALKRTQVNRNPLDPTRYGDWEKKGRCIDF